MSATFDEGELRAAANSAEGVAAVRAVAAGVTAAHDAGGGRGVGRDDLVARLLPDRVRDGLPTPALLEQGLPGLLGTEIARVRFADDAVVQDATDGVDQLVVIAAGLDTRAHRLPLARTRVFEVDRPAMLEVKRRRVGQALPSGASVIYVPVDLRSLDLAHALGEAGLDPARPTSVVYVGVSYYLDEQANERVLRWFAGLPRGGTMVMDYVFRRLVDGDDGFRGAAEVRRRLAAAGEHQIFGLDPGELSTLARTCGLDVEVDLGPDEIAQRFTAALDLIPLGYHCLARLRAAS